MTTGRAQLDKLCADGYVVVEVAIADDCIKPNRWVYCAAAQTLFTSQAVADDAQRLWPKAIMTTPIGIRPPGRAIALGGLP